MFVKNNKFWRVCFMKDALLEFYYEFHHSRHYFLCHDILEEAWKDNQSFTKDDPVVSLILLATGCYHYRRHNYKGAYRSFRKAKHVIDGVEDQELLGIDINAYLETLDHLIEASHQQKPYAPISLPLTETFQRLLMQKYPSFQNNMTPIEDHYIVHHHLKRDRQPVVDARDQAYRQRHQEK